jgi:hypothetical protein
VLVHAETPNLSANVLNASMGRRWAFLIALCAKKPSTALVTPLKLNTSEETSNVRVAVRDRKVPVTETTTLEESRRKLLRARHPKLPADHLDSVNIVHPPGGVSGIAEQLGHAGLRSG